MNKSYKGAILVNESLAKNLGYASKISANLPGTKMIQGSNFMLNLWFLRPDMNSLKGFIKDSHFIIYDSDVNHKLVIESLKEQVIEVLKSNDFKNLTKFFNEVSDEDFKKAKDDLDKANDFSTIKEAIIKIYYFLKKLVIDKRMSHNEAAIVSSLNQIYSTVLVRMSNNTYFIDESKTKISFSSMNQFYLGLVLIAYRISKVIDNLYNETSDTIEKINSVFAEAKPVKSAVVSDPLKLIIEKPSDFLNYLNESDVSDVIKLITNNHYDLNQLLTFLDNIIIINELISSLTKDEIEELSDKSAKLNDGIIYILRTDMCKYLNKNLDDYITVKEQFRIFKRLSEWLSLDDLKYIINNTDKLSRERGDNQSFIKFILLLIKAGFDAKDFYNEIVKERLIDILEKRYKTYNDTELAYYLTPVIIFDLDSLDKILPKEKQYLVIKTLKLIKDFWKRKNVINYWGKKALNGFEDKFNKHINDLIRNLEKHFKKLIAEINYPTTKGK